MSLRVRVEKNGTLWFEIPLNEAGGEDSPTVLELLEVEAKKVGHVMPFGCRSGSCATCQLEVIEGMSLLESPGPTEEDTIRNFSLSASTRLSCRARFREGASGLLKLAVPTW